MNPDPFKLSAAQIESLVGAGKPRAGLLPELQQARGDIAALRASPSAQLMLALSAAHIDEPQSVPQTLYSPYRAFKKTGERRQYETPYFLKRARLSAFALRLFLGEAQWKDAVQNHLWSICEESNWVAPAHEDRAIDLFSAETALLIGETLALLGDELDLEVRERARAEVERRVFAPYLRAPESFGWYRGENNWNGVCNSSIAATFLLLEPDAKRVARAVALALTGLDVFLDKAFEADGSSTEGVDYWHYGLMNFVMFSEMLRSQSDGAIDLLAMEKMRLIAAYPPQMRLSGSHFAPFSDCEEFVRFHPGIVARLAERAQQPSLLGILDYSGLSDSGLEYSRPKDATPQDSASALAAIGDPAKRPLWRLPTLLRNMLWWDGAPRAAAPIEDALLPAAAVARFCARAIDGAEVVVAIKAGHNAEHHNHNDVGSFIIHAGGETFLTDPGRGLYSRDYFSERRYENIFANSFGHSVPRIGGKLQNEGREFCGVLLENQTGGQNKSVKLEFARAYDLKNLQSAQRRIEVGATGEVLVEDEFFFSDAALEIEEAFVTWLTVEIKADGSALVRGERHDLHLTIQSPQGANFQLESLEDESRANAKPGVLQRMTFLLPPGVEARAQVKMQLLSKNEMR